MDTEDVGCACVCVCVCVYNVILFIKMTEILPFLATWMNLEGIMLSDISQMEKGKYCMISLICGI